MRFFLFCCTVQLVTCFAVHFRNHCSCNVGKVMGQGFPVCPPIHIQQMFHWCLFESKRTPASGFKVKMCRLLSMFWWLPYHEHIWDGKSNTSFYSAWNSTFHIPSACLIPAISIKCGTVPVSSWQRDLLVWWYLQVGYYWFVYIVQ